MYDYIKGQWEMKKVSQSWVMACVPKFITAEQCAYILSLPQNGITLAKVSE